MISRPPLLPAALPIEPFVQPCLLPTRSLRERARQAGRPFCMWGLGFFRLRRVVRGGDGGGVMRFQSRSFSCRARRARSQPSSSLSSISLFAVSICVLLFSAKHPRCLPRLRKRVPKATMWTSVYSRFESLNAARYECLA